MKKKSRAGRRGSVVEACRLIGMIHLPALPGSARAALPMQAIVERAVREAKMLVDAGFEAVIVENFGDSPFAADRVPRETIAAMSVITDHVVRAVGVPVGVNVLRNDGLSGLAVAAATGAAFIRVNVLSGVYATDQGFITGRPDELLPRRAMVAPRVKIAADVHVKHAQPISQPDIALAAEETAHRAGADMLIVSGAGTGYATDLQQVQRVKQTVPDRPVWIGSGVTAATVAECLESADGVIVGTALKRGGKTTAEMDAKRLREFIAATK
ncbi:MAG: BtpA/SgcQ family protein [Planctomycetota bacterium]